MLWIKNLLYFIIFTFSNFLSINCGCNAASHFCPDTVTIIRTKCGILRLHTDWLNQSGNWEFPRTYTVPYQVLVGLFEQLERKDVFSVDVVEARELI